MLHMGETLWVCRPVHENRTLIPCHLKFVGHSWTMLDTFPIHFPLGVHRNQARGRLSWRVRGPSQALQIAAKQREKIHQGRVPDLHSHLDSDPTTAVTHNSHHTWWEALLAYLKIQPSSISVVITFYLVNLRRRGYVFPDTFPVSWQNKHSYMW